MTISQAEIKQMVMSLGQRMTQTFFLNVLNVKKLKKKTTCTVLWGAYIDTEVFHTVLSTLGCLTQDLSTRWRK